METVSHAPGISDDSQARVGARYGREEARIRGVEITHVIALLFRPSAEALESRSYSIEPA